MVKIAKIMMPKHKETLSPWIQEFVESATATSLELLPQHLATFPSRWPFPRGDLYHWIPLLNRFDSILQAFCTAYGLHNGPQTKDFKCELLTTDLKNPVHILGELGYGEDGDRQLVESILNFSRLLLENCGNRSIYASSPYLSDLLNSTSLSLVAATLQIGTQLAQRYQASYKRLSGPSRHASSALLLNHYNIDLEKVQQLAKPFVLSLTKPQASVTPTPKSRENSSLNTPMGHTGRSVTTLYAHNLVSLVKTEENHTKNASWDDWGEVHVTFKTTSTRTSPEAAQNSRIESESGSSSVPSTPTPVRRSSNLGHQGSHRTGRQSASDEVPSPSTRPSTSSEATQSGFPEAIHLVSSTVTSKHIHELLAEAVEIVPPPSQYELLTKLRIAKALTTSTETRQQALAVRILAITNLAYIHPEQTFVERVLKTDGDEPRNLQLVYQLAELIQPPTEGQSGIPRFLQTIALSGLEALAQHQNRHQAITAALNTNVNHGVLLYIIRKAVAEMAVDEPGEMATEKDQWRNSLFALLQHVAALPRAGSELVTAGLVPILVEILTLRTSVAQHNYPKVLNFLDAIMPNRDAFQSLVNANGLDAISDLMVHEINSASKCAKDDQGLKPEFRSPSIDYQIPYFQQQSIKWLFKFIHHIMTSSNNYGPSFDRLLRNLIDSTPLLSSLREILGHAHIFGSTVWTNAVNILSDFINNEPTSFAIIAEAGLSREFLEAVTGRPIKMPEESRAAQSSGEPQAEPEAPSDSDDDSINSMAVDEVSHPPTAEMLEGPRDGSLARGIIPSAEAMNAIPQAFGVICLNNSGMRMFQASNALQCFFEIFESPAHVKCLETDNNLASDLGSVFDELVRHHPPLKNAIINATLDMVARVAYLCKKKSSEKSTGANLWMYANGDVVPADGRKPVIAASDTAQSAKTKGKANGNSSDTDIEMSGLVEESILIQPKSTSMFESTNGITPYVYAVATFLSALFNNGGVKVAFMEKGGIEFLLDLAGLPVLPNSFADDRTNRGLQSVIAMLAESKPHLVIPSLLKRTQAAADNLIPFTQHRDPTPFFGGSVSKEIASRMSGSEYLHYLYSGTQFVESLVKVQALTATLRQCVQTPTYNQRTQVTGFSSLNLTDYYTSLIKSLTSLLGASIREDYGLQNLVSPSWDSVNRQKDLHGYSNDSLESRYASMELLTSLSSSANDGEHPESQSATDGTSLASSSVGPPPPTSKGSNKDKAYFKNFITLRLLLAKMHKVVAPFFHVLAKALIFKRTSSDPQVQQRQNYASIADALAESALSELKLLEFESGNKKHRYWVVMLDVIKDILISSSRPGDRPYECFTLVLQAFKDRNGFDALNKILLSFTDVSKASSITEKPAAGSVAAAAPDYKLASVGTNKILDLYRPLVTGRVVVEAPQTSAMTSRSERDRPRSDFSSGQFLVELRMAILPVVRQLWESDVVEKSYESLADRLMEIIRLVATADYEQGASKRADKTVPRPKPPKALWEANEDYLKKLTDAGFPKDLAEEALFRCCNGHTPALEYCKAQSGEYSGGRNPIPQGEMDVSEGNGVTGAITRPSTGTATPDTHSMQIDSTPDGTAIVPDRSMPPPPIPNQLDLNQILDDPMSMSFDNLLEGITRTFGEDITTAQAAGSSSSQNRRTSPSPNQQSPTGAVSSQSHVVTVEDLDDERSAIRARLIERCLDVINSHGTSTFEVADLITTVVEKSPDPVAMRKEMGDTLVNALMSFVFDDDIRAVGTKVAAYAHLLAIMLQDKPFYNASIGELKANIDTIFEFVKLSPHHSAEEKSPWIAPILLILETLLGDDAQPQETDWKIPSSENAHIDAPAFKVVEAAITTPQRMALFEAILEILPRIGKDEKLALQVLRILVILTRTRQLAQIMGERKNIQRLFVLAKQLSGASHTDIQGDLIIVLRHIIEDDETIMQIMRADIKNFFEAPRPQRHIDVATYLRQLSHLVVRAPELFVKVSNEMVKLIRWSPNVVDSPGRQQLELQEEYRHSSRPRSVDTVLPTLQATEELTLQDSEDIKPTTEAATKDAVDNSKASNIDHKAPIIENPDGVIHFLLCELLNYKDVDDKDPASLSTEKPLEDSAAESSDTPMLDVSFPDSASHSDVKESKKPSKQEFKPAEHPIYVYRCFLLQCLAELLSSYNRTKIEFINFKRNAHPQVMTPSKPRSSVVNYLLTELLPVGVLDHANTIAHRKQLAVSTRADSVITSLLAKTGEHITDKDSDLDSDDEPDLLFVRRFVLENVLKAYREASASTEPLDIRYSKMLSLADLMNHIMSGKDTPSNAGDSSVASQSSAQLQRIMFEKGFISALTASIADIDVNFATAKRAVKHILRPLKVLTQRAIKLSEAGKIPSIIGQNDDDELISLSSLSEIEDEREETPDLFRNSTLGMFEPGRDHESSSESEDDDEEMYEGEYDEELDYEEEIVDDEEDNISDEDEDIDAMGEIEGLPGEHGLDVEVIMEEDDDDVEDDDVDDEEDEASDDEEDDEEEIEPSDEDDERVEIVDEHGNPLVLGGGEDDDWQSDDEEDEYEGRAPDEVAEDEVERFEALANGPIGHLVRALGGDAHGEIGNVLQRIEEGTMDAEDQMELEGYLEDEPDEDDEEDEEDIEEDEGLYDEYHGPPPGMAVDWYAESGEPPTIISRSHHHHHHRPRHGVPTPFPWARDPLSGTSTPLSNLSIFRSFMNQARYLDAVMEEIQEIMSISSPFITSQAAAVNSANPPPVPAYRGSYRSHRPGSTPRGNDDGTNPLLLRPGYQGDGSRPGSQAGPLGSSRDNLIEVGFGRRGLFSSPQRFLNEIVTSLPLPINAIHRHGHNTLHFQVTGDPRDGDVGRELQEMFGMNRRVEPHRDTSSEPGHAVFFTPQSTSSRWIREAKLLFKNSHPEKAMRVLLRLMSVLVPPVMKAEVKAAEERKAAEEKRKREEDERIAKERKEAEERAAREQKEAEERAAAEQQRAEEAAARAHEDAEDENIQDLPENVNVEPMEGVEDGDGHTVDDTSAAEVRPRVTTVIRGTQIDITDLGIDADFLQELPEDIREEVITSAVAERRSQAAAAGAQPSEIDQEFLDALPEEIRDEIIQQERQDRRRREREEQRRQAAAANGGNAAAATSQDMDAASILATLPPDLRAQVLAEQDEDVLAQLPPEYVAQARAAVRDHPLLRSMGGIGRPRLPIPVNTEQSLQKSQKRSYVQMVDKSGVATLLRLMFIVQHDSLKNILNQVLENISHNKHTRAEVISTILHVLQDGSIDMTAVERSFMHLSLKAKQPKDKEPKTPQPLKRTSTVPGLSITASSEVSPLVVVQQCLATLTYLCTVNFHVPLFFISEHESAGALKRSTSRKGKGKETTASKYPLNSLLGLLDRKLVMESPSVMQNLSELLNRVTTPLQTLERKQKEASGVKNNENTATQSGAPDHNGEAEGAAGAPAPTATSDEASDPTAEATRSSRDQTSQQTSNPKESGQKTQRPMVPPVIPDDNLKLVINIFVARECSAHTFRDALSTIKNLSCIPEAKAVFGRELVRKAQEMAEVILVDLKELLPQIQNASTGTEIQGVALAKFSPSGSDQNKLLRVLTALDHLFDPKNNPKPESATNGEHEASVDEESSRDIEKHDLLATLYENSTFGPMWEKLSACLSAIRQREHMLSVATILLPLIESLMVVCKNTTLKDTPISKSQTGKEMLLTSPPPESRMENLFFTFTEEHRKILNELVRHTPKLMSGTFSLLVKNPKVLEFDNKRNYFNRSIHNRSSASRQNFQPLQLSVRRDQVFHDSFRSLFFKSGDEMKYGKLSIRFHGEEGVDAGGVTREWFQVLSRQMFDPGYALFIPVSSDRTTFHPNPLSSINPEHLMFFKFIGRVIGKALYEGRVLDCHFSRAVYKRILGKSVSIKDLESLDPEYYKSVLWMIENDITDIITETFSVDNDKFGVVETIDLIENGRNIPVTQENKHEYVRLMVEFKLTGSVQEQLDHFLKGFHEIIPAELVAIFNEQELELLISGLPEIDVDDWKSNTEYHNYTGASPQIQWFWRAVRSFDKEEQAKLLQFVTGTSKVPLNGFKELEGMNGFSRFNIHRDYGNKDRLPSSHTCFNQLDLPEYESYDILRQQLLLAITAGSDYFGFA